MKFPAVLSMTAIALFALFSVPQTADAQILKKVTKAATDAAEDETANQVDRLVTEAVACAFDDPQCIEEAEESGQPVVLISADGKVITDDEGRPITDPDEAAAKAGGAGEDASADAPMAPGADAWANYDFVPGEQILYFDDFSEDEAGDFPRRLEWLRGNMELVEWEGRLLLRATGESQFAILVDGGVPQQFTLEFDIHDPATESGTIIVTEEAPQNSRDRYVEALFNFGSWRGSGIWREREPLSTVEDERMAAEIVTARIMVDGAHAKVFINEKRISNAPRVELARGDRITFEMWARDDHPIYVGNIRLAGGGRDLYDALATEGRVATRGILFDFNSDRLRPESTPTLEEIGEMLESHPDLTLIIEGHTDDEGDEAYNLELSQKRSEAVVRYLVDSHGIDADRLDAMGFGERNPVADNATPEGRQQNRRVELVVRD